MFGSSAQKYKNVLFNIGLTESQRTNSDLMPVGTQNYLVRLTSVFFGSSKLAATTLTKKNSAKIGNKTFG